MSRVYIKHNGSWRAVYPVDIQTQTTILGEDVKMVEYKLTKSSKTTHMAEASKFKAERPRQPRAIRQQLL